MPLQRAEAPRPPNLDRISGLALSAAGWAYGLITLLICFDILARRLLGFSTESTVEISGYLLAIGMSWGLAGTLCERAHVRIDVLLQKFPAHVRAGLHIASLLALLTSVGFFTWGAFSLAYDSFIFRSTDLSTLRVPMALPQGAWAAGFALFLVSVVALLCRSLHKLWAKDYAVLDAMLMARTYQEEARETLQAIGSKPHAGLAPVETRKGRE